MSRKVRTEDSEIDITQRQHEKSGTSSVTPPVNKLGGSSKSTAEINDALHEYSSSFDQIRLLRRRLITATGGDSKLNLHLEGSRTRIRQRERQPELVYWVGPSLCKR